MVLGLEADIYYISSIVYCRDPREVSLDIDTFGSVSVNESIARVETITWPPRATGLLPR